MTPDTKSISKFRCIETEFSDNYCITQTGLPMQNTRVNSCNKDKGKDNDG